MKTKKAIRSVCPFLLAALLTACGEKKSEPAAQAPAVSGQSAEADAPYSDPVQENRTTVTLGGSKYEVTVRREPDKDLPVVQDEFGGKYCDNRVSVTVTRDGAEFFSKSFTKEAFADFLTEAETKGTVLLGMAFDGVKTDSRAICLGAQVGEAGIGEGALFSVEIPLNGGALSIVRDMGQDTAGEDGMGD